MGRRNDISMKNLRPNTPETAQKVAASRKANAERRQQAEAIAEAVARIEAEAITTTAAAMIEFARRITTPCLIFLHDVVQNPDHSLGDRIRAAQTILRLGHADGKKVVEIGVPAELPGGAVELEPGKSYGTDYLLERMQSITRALSGGAPERKDPS